LVAASEQAGDFISRENRYSKYRQMRTDILPLCNEHYRTMELCVAPFSKEYSIEYFKCTAQFCRRCFSERLGYAIPQRGGEPAIAPNQPHCDYHNRPMFISSLDRQRNLVRYACPEAGCPETGTEKQTAVL
jgi:hypothetical protein